MTSKRYALVLQQSTHHFPFSFTGPLDPIPTVKNMAQKLFDLANSPEAQPSPEIDRELAHATEASQIKKSIHPRCPRFRINKKARKSY